MSKETDEQKAARIKAEELKRRVGQKNPNETDEQASFGGVYLGNFSDLIRKHDEELEGFLEEHKQYLGVNEKELEEFQKKFIPRPNSADKADNNVTSNNDISTSEAPAEQKPDPRWARAFLGQMPEAERQALFTEVPAVTTKLNDLTRSLSEEMRKDLDNFQNLKPDQDGKITIETEGEKLILQRDKKTGNIDIPTQIKPGQGPLTLSFAHVRNDNKQNMSEESAVYDLFFYDENGKLVDIITPPLAVKDHDGVDCKSKVRNLPELRKQLLQNRKNELEEQGHGQGPANDGVALSARGGASQQQASKIEDGISIDVSKEDLTKQNAAAIIPGSKDDGSGTKDPSKMGLTKLRRSYESDDITLGVANKGAVGIERGGAGQLDAKINSEISATTSEDLDNAAIKIQAAYRGHLARKNMKRSEKEEQGDGVAQANEDVVLRARGGAGQLDAKINSEISATTSEDLDNAATKIQAAYRGHLVRKDVDKQNAAEEPINRNIHKATGAAVGAQQGTIISEETVGGQPQGLGSTEDGLNKQSAKKDVDISKSKGPDLKTAKMLQDLLFSVTERDLDSLNLSDKQKEKIAAFKKSAEVYKNSPQDLKALSGFLDVTQEIVEEIKKIPGLSQFASISSTSEDMPNPQDQAATKIQAAYRRYLARKALAEQKAAAEVVERNGDKYLGPAVVKQQGTIISEETVGGQPQGLSSTEDGLNKQSAKKGGDISKSKGPDLKTAKMLQDLLFSVTERDLDSLNLSDKQKEKIAAFKTSAEGYEKNPKDFKALRSFLDATQKIVEEINKISGGVNRSDYKATGLVATAVPVDEKISTNDINKFANSIQSFSVDAKVDPRLAATPKVVQNITQEIELSQFSKESSNIVATPVVSENKTTRVINIALSNNENTNKKQLNKVAVTKGGANTRGSTFNDSSEDFSPSTPRYDYPTLQQEKKAKAVPVVVPPLDFSFLNQSNDKNSSDVWTQYLGSEDTKTSTKRVKVKRATKTDNNQISTANLDPLFINGRGVVESPEPDKPTGVIQDDFDIRYGGKPNLAARDKKVYPIDDIAIFVDRIKTNSPVSSTGGKKNPPNTPKSTGKNPTVTRD